MLRVVMRGYPCTASSSVCPGGRTFVFKVSLGGGCKSPMDVDGAKFPPAFPLDLVRPKSQISFGSGYGPDGETRRHWEGDGGPTLPPSYGTMTPPPTGRPAVRPRRLGGPGRSSCRRGSGAAPRRPLSFLQVPCKAVTGFHRWDSPAGQAASTLTAPVVQSLVCLGAALVSTAHAGPLTAGNDRECRGQVGRTLQARQPSHLGLSGRNP